MSHGRLRRYEIAISGARNNAPGSPEEASERLGASMANRASPAARAWASAGVPRDAVDATYLRPLLLPHALLLDRCRVQ